MRRGIGLLLVAALMLCAMPALGSGAQPVELTYYYYNPCGACHEGEEFEAWFRERALELTPDVRYSLHTCNAFRDPGSLEAAMEALGLDGAPPLPMLVLGGAYLSGRGAMESDLASLLGGAAKAAQPAEAGQPDEAAASPEPVRGEPFLLYYAAEYCRDCRDVSAFLDEQPGIASGEVALAVRSAEDRDGLMALFDAFGAPEDVRYVPVIFCEGGYLAGRDAIIAQLGELIDSGACDYDGFLD